MKQSLFFTLLTCIAVIVTAQNNLTITEPHSGIKLTVINQTYPLLQILLPGQPATERGIEVEFPEHVTGVNLQTNAVEQLYFVTRGERNKRTLPTWKIDGNTLLYETVLNGTMKLTAKAQLDTDGIRYSYTFTNTATVAWQNLQAVTCVKLYSAFSDTLLERTYVHHTKGFDLLASETPERLTMPLQKWLPCRYLVSYTWPVPANKIQKGEDGITRYNKSRKVDMPMIATISHDKKWVAATYTAETGNLWTNPERTCHHADPAIALGSNETKTLMLKTFLYQGRLEQLLKYIEKENKAIK
ncbi:hypothetical protein [Ferruginibacter sp.]